MLTSPGRSGVGPLRKPANHLQPLPQGETRVCMDYPATDGVLGGGADAFNLLRVAGSRDDTRDQRVGRQTQLELPSRCGGTLRGSCTLTRPPNPLIVYTCSQTTAPWVRSGTGPPSREPNFASVFGTRSGKPGEACEPPDSNAIGPIPLRPPRQEGRCPGLTRALLGLWIFHRLLGGGGGGRLNAPHDLGSWSP